MYDRVREQERNMETVKKGVRIAVKM
uniref:Uncharacterized protein n=1 Tax=Anguilla anguilla TaxID=7936 RepID=A0A0E9V9T9_ANGAN